MRVAIRKVAGVDAVSVSLNKGLAKVTFKPGNRATVEQVRDIVRRNGFTPKAADVRVAGRLVEHAGKPALAVTGADVVYVLAEDPDAKGKASELQRSARDRELLVSGRVPESPPDTQASLTLQVREFTVLAR